MGSPPNKLQTVASRTTCQPHAIQSLGAAADAAAAASSSDSKRGSGFSVTSVPMCRMAHAVSMAALMAAILILGTSNTPTRESDTSRSSSVRCSSTLAIRRSAASTLSRAALAAPTAALVSSSHSNRWISCRSLQPPPRTSNCWSSVCVSETNCVTERPN